MLRAGLDGLYRLAGIVAALCLVAILGLIVAQMIARWSNTVFPGAPDYAGYAMAGASFLAFADALGRGAHIRVSVLFAALGARGKHLLEIWCHGLGAVIMWYVVWYGWRFVGWSFKFNDVSQGLDRTPLWIPQSLMLIGTVIFAIALTDRLVQLIRSRDHG